MLALVIVIQSSSSGKSSGRVPASIAASKAVPSTRSGLAPDHFRDASAAALYVATRER
jgi:hypothetical protein